MFYRRKVRYRPLSTADIDTAAQLLTEEFCRREPLCRHLSMPVAELLPFFREQVAWTAQNDLGVVAENRRGELIAVVTADDHCAQYQPNPLLLTPALAAIGVLLERLTLPAKYETKTRGEVCYFGLAAVRPEQHGAPVLALLLAALTQHVCRKGYRVAYAKVTNPAILARMRRHDRFTKRQVFDVTAMLTDQDFQPGSLAPLNKFRVALVAWPTNIPVF